MPRGSYRGRYAARPKRTASWAASVDIQTPTATADGITRTVTLMDGIGAGNNYRQTHLRSLGNISVVPSLNNAFTLYAGIYKSAQSSGLANVVLNPALQDDVAIEQWLWWKVLTFTSTTNLNVGAPHGFSMPFDVKVSRIITENEQLLLTLVAHGTGINSGVYIRTLSKVTGT